MSLMPGKLMVDVTTLIAESGRIAHGTTRVERGIVAALAKINPPGLAFCRFDGLRQRFVGVPGDEVAGVLARPARAEAARQAPRLEAASRLSSHGKRIERLVRDHVGRPARRRISAAWRRIDRPHLPAATTLVSVGEIRFDLAVAGEVVARSDGAFVSTIFDVLPIGFAAKADPSMAERDMLASFDRLFRLSRMCLCISGATRREVERYADIRGLACPPCEVIPLADDLPAAAPVRPDVPVEPGAYVLSVGSITARKNQKLLVDIWRRFAARRRHPACKLVLVGAGQPRAGSLDRGGPSRGAPHPHSRQRRRRRARLALRQLPLFGVSLVPGRLRPAGRRKPRGRQAVRRELVERRSRGGAGPGDPHRARRCRGMDGDDFPADRKR
jgi:glycosyltransferase involved in cell wall biosynthesis